MTSEPSGQFINPMALGVPPNLLQGTFPLSHTASAASARNPPLSVLSNVLKLSNVPSDLTPREAALIFALVSDDLVSVDVKDYSIIASFKNPSTCLTTGKLLDGRYIFGAKYAPVKAELEPPAPASNSSSNPNNSISGFENLSLSNGISPPPSHSHSLQQPPQASSDLQSQQQPFDAYQKRASVGNQRSRFLFSDPFSGATTPTNTASGSIDLSDLTGKSLLLMKSQADGRDYESMPRDPWNSQSSTNLAFASNPQTPGIANVNPYDWPAATPSQASASMQPQPNPMPTSQKSPVDSSGERRRTSSFFNGSAQISQTPSHPVQASNSSLQNANSQLQNPNSSLQPSTSQLQNQSSSSNAQQQQQNPANQHSQSNEKAPAQTVAAIISQGPSQQSNAALPPLSTSQSGARSGPSSAAGAHSATTTPTSSGRGSSKDVLDLSLLARVPPPANPADQNPPCNTLYVGNLPPDATEAELRSLFAPQKGFRRLSFRTKNQPSNGGSNGGANGSNGSNSSGSNGNSNSSSHNHGPMCFVEFEDVAHATIALAELYGRALPRPAGSNSKGGIRLSFSKNPLGVRGPGNPRRTSNSQQPSSSGSSGVGNYGYSNYHNQ